MTPKRLPFILFFLFATISVVAQQNIAGIWEGKFLTNDGTLGQPRLVVEIYDVRDTSFSGITHLYYEGQKYEHYKMIGWFGKKDSLLVFREASTIAVDLGGYGNCLGTYMMTLKKSKGNLFQNGYWMPNIPGCTTNSIVWLQQRKPEPVPVVKAPVPETKTTPTTPVVVAPNTTAPPLQKQTTPAVTTTEPVTAPVAPVIKKNVLPLPEKIAKRETDVQSLLEIAATDKDSIKVEVYDNGDIDGDTVSVYNGEQLLIDRKMITARPLTFFVNLDKRSNPITHLRLVAESLGSIPPCTALMIVTTKTKRYEVRLSSSFKKNATVELFLKE